jgi:hypothetical protein
MKYEIDGGFRSFVFAKKEDYERMSRPGLRLVEPPPRRARRKRKTRRLVHKTQTNALNLGVVNQVWAREYLSTGLLGRVDKMVGSISLIL